ncbi:tubulin-like doman-containing protein [Candidatus Thiosymbion oneisti]|uniref:tubulin-like doman-containing protein n=1 Tax=Candidatus Thiosymbion oneisti TaxID=589554 RepID=UPI000B7F8A4B|nr:tubulin-like doman-containing protein [Candidatus Thiosymbion oneisti]
MRGLYIGIGGTGDEILARLKDKVFATAGTLPDTLQFRLIDTEAEDYRKNKGARLGGEGSATAIAGNEYLQLQDDPPGTFLDLTRKVARDPQSVAEMARWYRADLFQENLPAADYNLVRGAGQHRQFARMGVFLNKQRLVNMLRHAMENCGGGQGELPIWIVGSVAGGTGAGLYMDLALLARLVAEELRLRFRIIGAAVLPDAYQDVNIDGARAYAVVRELERFQAPVANEYRGRFSEHQDGIRFAVEYDTGTRVRLTDKLFDNLVFYNRECKNDDDRKSYFSEIADGLNLLLDETAGDQIFREWINAREGAATSFNSHRIFLPIRLYERQFVLDAALGLANGLLPRDPATQALRVGSGDDRRMEAQQILGEELFALFRILKAPGNDQERRDLSEKMKASFIVNEMLGFANPAGVFGQSIGADREGAAKRLFADIFEDIRTIRDLKEDFDDSKTRVQAEVALRRRNYEGDGKDSFNASLAAIRPLIREQIQSSIDTSIRKYLGSQRAHEEALGRTNRVIHNLSGSMADLRRNLEQVVADDGTQLERARGREKDVRVALEVLKKRLLGWKGQLADTEEDYLNAVNEVNQWLQRERLVNFIRDLIKDADGYLKSWLQGMAHWQEAILRVIQEATDEGNEIAERLDRQTKVRSASMGLKNDTTMDGYRDALREKCLLDPQTNKSFVEDLLPRLTWKPGDRPQDLALEGWPERELLAARDFAKTLVGDLSRRIAERVGQFEGMANYLKWLRDEKRDPVIGLADRLRTVTSEFLDQRPTSDTRKLLLLHGDIWNRERDGENALDTVYNALAGDSNMSGKITHNLTGTEGVSLFKDRNVLAVLMVDNAIPYQEIRVMERMRSQYLAVRDEDHPEWRAQTYHIFRCDQEAWRMEHAQVVETRDTHFPEIPGQLCRLLDDPKSVETFTKALVTGVVRGQPVATGGRVWVCGPVTEQGPKRLIFLNDPDDDKDPKDLLRALVTFAMDRNDRRRRIRGAIDLRRIQGWMEEALTAAGKTLEEIALAFKDAEPDLFELRLDEGPDGAEIGKDAFLALILNHHLGAYLGTQG